MAEHTDKVYYLNAFLKNMQYILNEIDKNEFLFWRLSRIMPSPLRSKPIRTLPKQSKEKSYIIGEKLILKQTLCKY